MVRLKLIDIARAELGTKENPPDSNRTKYGEWFGLNGLPWCAIFVSWCYAHAGHTITGVGHPRGFASCQAMLKWARENGKLVKDPTAGDIVLFDWNGDGRVEHTGIFLSWKGDVMFTCIEGNTSILNDSNGGEVMIRNRKRHNAYFVRLAV